MATHQSIKYLQQGVSQNGLVIHLGSLNFKAKKTDVEKLLKEHGFDKCTFFWPDVPPNQPGEHKGWCRVQFAEKKVAERAKSALQNTPLMGRPIKIGSIENTTAAPQAPAQQAQAQPTTAPITQPPQDPSTSSEPVAGILAQETISLATQASLGLSPSAPARAVAFSSSSSSSSSSAVQPTNVPSSSAAVALRSLRLTEYPKSWFYNPENPGLAQESVMSRMKQLERAYENAGVVARPLVKEVPGDEAVALSQQYPSPAPHNSIFATKPFIWVYKGEGKHREAKRIELARLAEFAADGWEEWQYAGRPTVPGTDKDPRQILKINDVWENDAPYKDAAHMFAAEIKTASLADGLSWQPGQLLGDNPQARAPISHSPTFITPAESSKNFQSATSRGHQLKFQRPGGVGTGWGDHDLFREWQIHGRQVRRSMVENKEWRKDIGGSFEFVPAPDSPAGTRGVTFFPDEAVIDKFWDEEAPKSLFEALNPKHQASQRGGRGGGYSGRGQGAAGAAYEQRRRQTGEDQDKNW